jgi:hypothetical protein
MFGTFEELLRTMASTLRGDATDERAPSSGSADQGQASSSKYRALLDLLTEVHLAYMRSGFRYMSRWSETCGRYYPKIIQALSTAAGDPDRRSNALGAVMDDLKAYMREMGQLPLDESQRLQAELASMLQKFRPAGGEASAPYRRRRKAKE